MDRQSNVSTFLYIDSPVEQDAQLKARRRREQSKATITSGLSEPVLQVPASEIPRILTSSPESIGSRPTRGLTVDTEIPRYDWFDTRAPADVTAEDMLRSAYLPGPVRVDDRGTKAGIDSDDDKSGTPSNQDTSAAWAKCAKNLWDHDEATVKSWKEEIDTLLVFAGLFSAVLTAFNVQCYQLLQPAPQDSTTQFLAEISTQLSSLRVNDAFINSTQPSLFPSETDSSVLASSVWINALWFSSLVCSLASASVAISIKQWLNSYTRRASTMSRQSARIRQHRHNGLVKWRVIGMINILPILLQSALILFFIGLMILLWQLNSVVACITSVLVAALFLFTLLTSILPAFAEDCPYKSPQAWWFFLVAQWIRSLFSAAAPHTRRWIRACCDRLIRLGLPMQLQDWLDNITEPRIYRNWRERENFHVNQIKTQLDRSVVAFADAAIMDDGFLEEVVRPCLNDLELDAALPSFHAILKHRAHRFKEHLPDWSGEEHDGQAIATMARMTIDIFLRIRSDYCDAEWNQKRILVLLDRLFDTQRAEKTWGCDRLLGKVSGILNRDVPVQESLRDHAFCWVEKLALHNQLDTVRFSDVKSVLSYMAMLREANDAPKFMRACLVAGHLSAALPGHQYKRIRNQLQDAFASLDVFLSTPASKSVVAQSSLIYQLVFLPSVVFIARRDNTLMTSGAVAHLMDVFERTLALLGPHQFRRWEVLDSPRVKPLLTDLHQLHQELSERQRSTDSSATAAAARLPDPLRTNGNASSRRPRATSDND